MPDSDINREELTLEANGFRFETIAAGPPDGSLVLLLHGFPEFADAWAPILQSVGSHGYRAVAVNQRGYSPGARPSEVESYATEHLVADVLGFADALHAARFHLVGHDWGGLVAWQLAAEHPERVASLGVLSTPHPNAFLDALLHDKDQQERSRYIALFRAPGHMAEGVLLADNARQLRAAYQGKVAEPQVNENVRRLNEPEALTATLNWYRALDLSTRVGNVAVPTLFAWGSEDMALGATAAKNTANFVTGPYRFEVLNGKSHWLLEEAPEEISTFLFDQLSKNGSF